MISPHELFRQGLLEAALKAAGELVRSQPSSVEARSVMRELLCFSGEFDRADKQLDAILQLEPSTAPGVLLIRQLIQCERNRWEVFHQGRVPAFIAAPSESQMRRMEALLALRENNDSLAVELASVARDADLPVSGHFNGTAFSAFFDLDDLMGSTLEIFDCTGNYYWIDAAQIVSLELEPPDYLTDQLWRTATLETTEDLSGRVYVPVIYVDSRKSDHDLIRIGRATDWSRNNENSLVRGLGQKEMMADDHVVAMMEIKTISFEPPLSQRS